MLGAIEAARDRRLQDRNRTVHRYSTGDTPRVAALSLVPSGSESEGGAIDRWTDEGGRFARRRSPPRPLRASRRRADGLAEVQACGDLADDDRGDDPVDDHAERRPPTRVGDEMASVLPEILESVADQTDHEQPR